MKDYLLILLLIVPGFVARAILANISSKGEGKSEFDKTVMSLIYSLPINLVNIFILRYNYNYLTLSTVYNKFNEIKFTLKYVLLTMVVTLVISVLIEIINKYILLNAINLIRKLFGNEEKSSNYCAWDEFFQFNGEKFKAVKIIKGDRVVSEGFVKNSTYSNDEDKEVILEYGDLIEQYRSCFSLVKSDYYNTKLDLRIQEYDLSLFLEQYNQRNNPVS